MKERILKNWTVMRILYVVMGGIVVAQSIATHEWAGIVFGGYFAAMGIFSFGCAAGNCAHTPRRTPHTSTMAVQEPDITYEEVK